jgi:hypothetical protein
MPLNKTPKTRTVPMKKMATVPKAAGAASTKKRAPLKRDVPIEGLEVTSAKDFSTGLDGLKMTISDTENKIKAIKYCLGSFSEVDSSDDATFMEYVDMYKGCEETELSSALKKFDLSLQGLKSLLLWATILPVEKPSINELGEIFIYLS